MLFNFVLLFVQATVVASSYCSSKKFHMDQLANPDPYTFDERRCIVCTLWKAQPSTCEYCFQDKTCRESKGSTCPKDLSAQTSADNEGCKQYVKWAKAYESFSKIAFEGAFERCREFLETKRGPGKEECMDVLERSFLIHQLLDVKLNAHDARMYKMIVQEIERSQIFLVDRTDKEILDVLSRRATSEVKKLAVDALLTGPMRILVPGTGASLEAAPLKATQNSQFFYKSLRRDTGMNELSNLKTLIGRGFVDVEQKNPFLMKIIAILNMNHAKSHIFMEDAKRGLGSSAVQEKCKAVRTYDVKGLPHRRRKTSGVPYDERIIPKTGVDGDFYQDKQLDLFHRMTSDQCSFFQASLLAAINYLTPTDASKSEQMIDFSFLFTIATDCEEDVSALNSVCTAEGELGCFIVDKTNLIAVSVIDYLNNMNTVKRLESSMSTGASHLKFHRYNEYTSTFVRSLCISNDDTDGSSSIIAAAPSSSSMDDPNGLRSNDEATETSLSISSDDRNTPPSPLLQSNK